MLIWINLFLVSSPARQPVFSALSDAVLLALECGDDGWICIAVRPYQAREMIRCGFRG